MQHLLIPFPFVIFLQLEFHVSKLSKNIKILLLLVKSNNKLLLTLTLIPKGNISISTLKIEQFPSNPHKTIVIGLSFIELGVVQEKFLEELGMRLLG